MMRGEYELAISQFDAQRRQAAETGDREQELQAREDLASPMWRPEIAEALGEDQNAQAAYARVGRLRNVAFSRSEWRRRAVPDGS